jgi:hypothetical protein
MQGVSRRVCGHYPVPNVGLDDLQNGILDRQDWKARNQCDAVCARSEVATLELVNDSHAGNEVSSSARRATPPFTRPFPPGDHLRFRTCLKVEARNRSLDVCARSHSDD